MRGWCGQFELPTHALRRARRSLTMGHMGELLRRLHFERFMSARLVGTEIHLTAHGTALIVRQDGTGFAVSAASDDQVTRVCADADAVIAEIRNW